jgi:hypothetical protein
VPVVALVAANFYLHGRYLTGRPANATLMTAVGLVDIAMITVGVLAWPAGKGIFSPFFILYFPVIVAFAFVMPRKVTLVFTGVALAAYVGASFAADVIYSPKELYPELHQRVQRQFVAAAPAATVSVAAAEAAADKTVNGVKLSSGRTGTVKLLLMRLITLAAMSGLGTYYWRIQRNRRRESSGGEAAVHVGAAVEPDRLGFGVTTQVSAGQPVGGTSEVSNGPTVA